MKFMKTAKQSEAEFSEMIRQFPDALVHCDTR